jgi:ribonuclease BN (tRNA processing enzyme)
MDAAEAGREAARAGATRLLLTHVPDEIGHDAVLERARAEFAGPVDIAHPRLRIEV